MGSAFCIANKACGAGKHWNLRDGLDWTWRKSDRDNVLGGLTLYGGQGMVKVPALDRALSANHKPWEQDSESVTYLGSSRVRKYQPMSSAYSSSIGSTDLTYHRIHYFPPRIARENPCEFFMVFTSLCVQRLRAQGNTCSGAGVARGR